MVTSPDPTTRGVVGVIRTLGPIICALLVTTMLVACAPAPIKEPLKDVVLVPEVTSVDIPAETMRDCDPIPRLEERAYKQVEVTEALNKIVTVASDCRKRKKDATDSLRKALNVPSK